MLYTDLKAFKSQGKEMSRKFLEKGYCNNMVRKGFREATERDRLEKKKKVRENREQARDSNVAFIIDCGKGIKYINKII